MNAIDHQMTAALVVGGALSGLDCNAGKQSLRPLAGGLLAAAATKLPDILEPAIHPNHRQFFHSFVFAGLVGVGLKKLYDWEPKDDFEEAVRFVLMTSAAAYLCHLVLDASTPKSLPIIGAL